MVGRAATFSCLPVRTSLVTRMGNLPQRKKCYLYFSPSELPSVQTRLISAAFCLFSFLLKVLISLLLLRASAEAGTGKAVGRTWQGLIGWDSGHSGTAACRLLPAAHVLGRHPHPEAFLAEEMETLTAEFLPLARYSPGHVAARG